MIIDVFWLTCRGLTQLPKALRLANLPWPDFVSNDPEAIRAGLLVCRWRLLAEHAIECFFSTESAQFENWESRYRGSFRTITSDEAIGAILQRVDP